MKYFEIVSDTSNDLPKNYLEANDITEVSFYVRLEGDDYLKDGLDISRRELYDYLAENEGVFPKTSLPAVDDFVQAFRPILEEGKDIICFTVSSTLSGAYQSANVAADLVREEYKDREIYVIDSESASLGVGLLIEKAVKLRDKGLETKEANDILVDISKTTKIYIALYTLEYLEEGGRISKTKAFAGRLLNIKPVVSFRENQLHEEAKTRGMRRATEKILDLLDERVKDDPKKYDYLVIHGDVEDLALELKDTIERKYDLKIDSDVALVSAPVISHIGPGAVAVGCMEKLD